MVEVGPACRPSEAGRVARRNRERGVRRWKGRKDRASSRSHPTRELREKSERLDAILDGLSEGVPTIDLRDRVLFANPAARALSSMTEERIKSFDAVRVELPEAGTGAHGEDADHVADPGGTRWSRAR